MPTVYAELNAVLGELVETVRTTLGENFCGAYLQGSFALSHADADSDVDFIVVTRDEVTDAQLDALQDMHRRIYALPSPWAQHLEGGRTSRRSASAASRRRPLRSGTSTTAPPSSCVTRTATPLSSAGSCASTASSSPDRTRTA